MMWPHIVTLKHEAAQSGVQKIALLVVRFQELQMTKSHRNVFKD